MLYIEIMKQVEEKIKWEACGVFYLFSATSYVNSKIQEH